MQKFTLSLSAIASIAISFSTPLSADDGFSIFSNTKFNGEIRPRYEYVDVEDSGKKDANAYSARATIGLESTLLGVDGLSVKVDGTTVQTLGGTKYNDLSPTKFTDYEIVADPEQTRFTQGYLQYKYGKTTGKVGRQIVNLDNQRFIGSVDWRQMPQSLDAVSVSNTSIAGLSLYGAYVYSYATVFEEPTQKSESVLLNGTYKINDMVKITAYDYMLSLEKGSFAADTYGVAFSGDVPAAGAKISYRAEYAKQDDSTFEKINTDAKAQADASYYNLEAIANMMGISLGAGYEFLSGTTGSDGKTKFQTPLATLHKFNGTADKFLATPTGGLIDTSISLGYGTKTIGNALVTYHAYETDVPMATKSDLGSEWDLQYSNAIPGVKGLNGLIKAALYEGGDVAGYNKNVEKFWLQLGYKF